jgi:(2R)-3-sulfolactate dehydrogenase (NADP+)
MAHLTLGQVYELSLNALLGSGAGALQAVPVAESIREAEAQGIRNVGLGYLPVYCEHLRCGKIDGQAQPQYLEGAPAVVRVDAMHGFCHPAFRMALPRFAGLATEHGVAALAITRSYSAGVVGWFVEQLAARNLVSVAFANTSPCIAPWGGNKPLFGTNPLAFATPCAGGSPIVVDMAASATARVNIATAAARGESVPQGWLVDAQGAPTTDPAALNAGGTMSPLGGAKGYGLALMIEILAAGMTGANWSHAASSFSTNEGGPPGVGQLFIAMAPALTGGDHFQERLAELRTRIAEQPGARLPGARRHENRRRITDGGVDVPDELMQVLGGYARPATAASS